MKKNILISTGLSLIIFIISILLYVNFKYMGVSNSEVQNYIVNHYKNFIFFYNLKILLLYLFIGAVIGLLSFLFKIKDTKNITGFNLIIWLFFWFRAIKIYPQMFTDQLFIKGGIFKLLQVFITDYIPLWIIYIIPALIIIYIMIRKKVYIVGFLVFILFFIILFPFKTIPVQIKTEKPNILVLASDSLRPDHISYNGYNRKTPNMDYLFKNGANFLNLTASMGRTFPSWVTILTSLYPPDHKIRHMFPDFAVRKKRWITLVDILKSKGYFTGVISDFAGDIFSRIDLGFDKIDSPYFSIKTLIKQRSLEIHYFFISFFLTPQGKRVFPVMFEMALDPDPYLLTEKTKKTIVRSGKLGKPFFILTFYSCNHFPYSPKYPYYKLYTKKDYKGLSKYKKENLLSDYTHSKLRQEDIEQIRSLYDGGIKMFDDQVGDIVNFLKKTGVFKKTIIIIMSDHGENLYEESYGMGHGDHLRGNYANNMTFGIYSPFEDFKGIKIIPTARDIDISPTILDMLNYKRPKQFKGISLLPFMRGKKFSGLPAYMETGVWYTKNIPAIPKSCRMAYPEITELLTVDENTGEMYLKQKYEYIIINAKQRSIVFNNFKYIYIPCKKGIIKEIYNTKYPQTPEYRNKSKIKRLLNKVLEYKIFRMFPDKFIKLQKRYLIEKNSLPNTLKNSLFLYDLRKNYLVNPEEKSLLIKKH